MKLETTLYLKLNRNPDCSVFGQNTIDRVLPEIIHFAFYRQHYFRFRRLHHLQEDTKFH